MRSIWAPGAIVAAYSMSSAVSGVQPHAHPLLMQLLRLDWSTAICVNLSRRERFPNVSWLNCARILGLCSLRRLSLLLCPYLYIPGPRGSGLRQALLWLKGRRPEHREDFRYIHPRSCIHRTNQNSRSLHLKRTGEARVGEKDRDLGGREYE